MECQECHLRPATLHFTKIVNGQKIEYHLCDQCAKEKGDFMAESNGFSIHDLLSGLLNFEQPLEETMNQHHGALQCPTCGLTYPEFIKIGKFGCEDCYKTFNNKLDPVFRKIHGGNTIHKGKIPKRVGKDISVKRRLKDLKDHLQRLVEKEEFEKAAEVRDEIRSLEDRGDR
ncbi:UvrB/UvrC motif-containing protein [Scopulibacillus cellulosilyticus]|uniref:UvrB/UvrC motif-containing protein n=1 Tax=Scopulibacillus cellulosilyticus TaxID=2665665 RepID=A0ABW2Q0D0_9BACL